MMNKQMILIIVLLFSVLESQAMWFKDKDKKHSEPDHKTKIQTLDDVKKLREEQLQYRKKHNFKDEPNDVRIEEKK